MENGNDGYQITISQTGDITNMQAEFNRVRACGNSNDGIEFVSREDRLIKFHPLSQVVACGSQQEDFVMRGNGKMIFVMPSGAESTQVVGLNADSCKQYPQDESCYVEQHFLSCTEELCLAPNAKFFDEEVEGDARR